MLYCFHTIIVQNHGSYQKKYCKVYGAPNSGAGRRDYRALQRYAGGSSFWRIGYRAVAPRKGLRDVRLPLCHCSRRGGAAGAPCGLRGSSLRGSQQALDRGVLHRGAGPQDGGAERYAHEEATGVDGDVTQTSVPPIPHKANIGS